MIPEITTFSLESNGSIVIPVKINVPIDAQPGGFYTSVLVSNAPSVDSGAQSSEVEGTTKIVSRVGTLFFVRVNGVAKESGALDDLKVIYPTKDNPNLYIKSIKNINCKCKIRKKARRGRKGNRSVQNCSRVSSSCVSSRSVSSRYYLRHKQRIWF